MNRVRLQKNMLATLRIRENQMSQALFVKRNPLHKWNWSNLYIGILFGGVGVTNANAGPGVGTAKSFKSQWMPMDAM